MPVGAQQCRIPTWFNVNIWGVPKSRVKTVISYYSEPQYLDKSRILQQETGNFFSFSRYSEESSEIITHEIGTPNI
jgi:hypothetical protein